MSDAESEAGPPPRANPNLYGHEAAEQTLLEAFCSGRLAHACLLVGPRGIGKATLAYRFARFVLAQAAQAGLFAGPLPGANLAIGTDDPIFRRVASGGHADLLTVERGRDERGKLRGEILAEEARQVAEFFHLTPAEGGWRVVVIDGAEDMNRSAANAVLKIVEEPPAQALVLMVSHAPGRLLPTIRSRCRRLSLKPLDESVLLRVLAEQRPKLGEDEARALARLAEGSAGRAVELADQGGLGLFGEMLALVETLPRLDVAALHRLADRMNGSDGENAFRTVRELLLWWLVRLVRTAGSGEAPVEVVPGEAKLCGRLAGLRRLDRWLEVWEKTRHLFARAESINLERRQVMLNAFLALEGAARA